MRFGMFWGHGWPWLDGWPARKCCRHAEPLPCEHPKTWWWATGPCNAQDVIRGCGPWRVLSPDERCQHATISHYHNRTRGKSRPWRRCFCNLKQPEVQGQSFTFSALTSVHLYHVASTLHVLYILHVHVNFVQKTFWLWSSVTKADMYCRWLVTIYKLFCPEVKTSLLASFASYEHNPFPLVTCCHILPHVMEKSEVN